STMRSTPSATSPCARIRRPTSTFSRLRLGVQKATGSGRGNHGSNTRWWFRTAKCRVKRPPLVAPGFVPRIDTAPGFKAMKSRLPLLFLFLAIVTAQAQQTEYIIVVGGPSLHQWEQYKPQPHDHWWANFVHSARVRTEQLLTQVPPGTTMTWMVYKP